MDLAKVVSVSKPYKWTRASWELESNREPERSDGRFHVVVYDFGLKRNMLRLLVDRDCRVTVVPAKTTAAEVFKLKPDGVLLSNGPGDPEPCSYAIRATREFRSEEHTSELQSLMRNPYAVFCLKK